MRVTKGKRPECWVFVPDSMIGRMVTVYSLALSGSGYDTLSHHDYRVVRLPDPKPVLGLFHSGLCSPEVIMRDPVVGRTTSNMILQRSGRCSRSGSR